MAVLEYCNPGEKRHGHDYNVMTRENAKNLAAIRKIRKTQQDQAKAGFYKHRKTIPGIG